MRLSIAVDRSTVLPALRINGSYVPWPAIALFNRETRKHIRDKLATMDNGSKLVAYTMRGAKLPG